MFSAPKKNPMAAIEMRQRQEDVVRDYARVAAENGRQKMIADWEMKSSKTVASKELFRHMDRIQAQSDDILVARRQRLADLLVAEKAEHDQMLANLAETDDQRRERLTQQARELRSHREELRQQESQRLLEQRFRSQNDSLRQAESKVKALQVADERYEQLDEIERRREEARRLDQFYNDQKNAMEQAQRERAQKDLENMHQRTQKMQNDLRVQVAANQYRREEDKAQKQEDDAEFFRLLRAEEEANATKEAKKRQHRLELAAEIKVRNEELLKIKQEEYDKLRQEDKDALDELLRGIKEDEQREQAVKKRQREASAEHMKLVEAQMNVQAANESALDKLWQDENDREWDKREKKWQSEQAMRENLLRNVLNVRKDQIRDIRSRESQDVTRRQEDHKQLLATMKSDADRGAREASARRDAARQTRNYLEGQISLKHETMQREKDDSRRQDATEEELYKQRLAAELSRLETGKPDRYRHIPIAPRNRIF